MNVLQTELKISEKNTRFEGTLRTVILHAPHEVLMKWSWINFRFWWFCSGIFVDSAAKCLELCKKYRLQWTRFVKCILRLLKLFQITIVIKKWFQKSILIKKPFQWKIHFNETSISMTILKTHFNEKKTISKLLIRCVSCKIQCE